LTPPAPFAHRIVAPHLRFLLLGLTAIDLRLVPAWVNHEQPVASVHELAGLKAHFLHVTRNAWSHFDGLDGFGAACEFVPFNDFPLFHRCDGDQRWRRTLLCSTTGTTCGEEDGCTKRQCYGS